MGVVNRRNVALGYGAWRLSRSIRHLIREPEPEPPKRRWVPALGAAAAGAVAVGGAVVFWRMRRNEGIGTTPEG